MKSETPCCYFCRNENEPPIETIDHLFIHCPHIKPLWDYAESVINNLDVTYQLRDCTKILGIFDRKDDDITLAINHLLISIKYFIHISKFKECVPHIAGFKRFIRNTEYLERQVAVKRQKLATHIEKWSYLF